MKIIRHIIIPVVINIMVIIMLFLGVEIIYRVYIARRTIFERQPFFQYDPFLGWSPRPGIYHDSQGIVTIDSNGFRKTSDRRDVHNQKLILACGDSFTFGSGVSDEETWPSYLATRLDCRVINAGVSGYGLDQTVLCLSKVISKVEPDLVIVSMILDDIRRCGLSKRQRFKPYFKLSDGKLVLLNNPVPRPGTLLRSCAWYKNSLIIRNLIKSINGNLQPNSIRVHNRGMEFAPYLIDYAYCETKKSNARIMILIQPSLEDGWPDQVPKCRQLEAAIRSCDLPILNLTTTMFEKLSGKEEEMEAYFIEHMTPEGNRWIADELADYIKANHLINPIPDNPIF